MYAWLGFREETLEQNLRITELFGLGETLKVISFQLPAMGRGCIPLDHVGQGPIQPGLECVRMGHPQHLWHPVPVPHHAPSKEFPPCI